MIASCNNVTLRAYNIKYKLQLIILTGPVKDIGTSNTVSVSRRTRSNKTLLRFF